MTNPPNTHAFTWLKNDLVPSPNALISVDDRGFRFGDGVFETVRVLEGIPYRLEYHIERLMGGLRALRIAFDATHVPQACARLINANGVKDGILRIAVSRGSGSRGYLPIEPSHPTLIIQSMDAVGSNAAPATLYISSYRKPSPASLPVGFKLAQGVNSTLARMEAADHGADEALLLDDKGHVCEASAANIFFVLKGELCTPSAECGCLLGITRRIILEQEKVKEGHFTLEDLKGAESIVLTNASRGAVAVSKLLPGGAEWSSDALALKLNKLLEKDQKSYIAQKPNNNFC